MNIQEEIKNNFLYKNHSTYCCKWQWKRIPSCTAKNHNRHDCGIRSKLLYRSDAFCKQPNILGIFFLTKTFSATNYICFYTKQTLLHRFFSLYFFLKFENITTSKLNIFFFSSYKLLNNVDNLHKYLRINIFPLNKFSRRI